MPSSCRNSCNFWSKITIEPIVLLFSMSHGFYLIVAQSLYIAKVCTVNLNYTQELCDQIYIHKEEQIEVQKVVSTLQGYNGILQALPAIIYALFAGPWSDLHGRKLLIVWSCFGYIFNNGTFIINTIFWYELRAEFLLFECLQDFTGGFVCFFLGCYALISDITTKENRTKRLAFVDGLFPVGFYLGMSVSGIVRKKLGFVYNFGLGMLGAILAMLYTIFFIKETERDFPKEVSASGGVTGVESTEKVKAAKGRCASMFDLQNLMRSFRVTFRYRPNGLRPYLLLVIVIFVLETFVMHGGGPVLFLFFRKEFSWDESTFGQYIALFGVVGLFTQFVAVPFLTDTWHFHDTTLGFLAVLGCAVQQVIMAFATEDWQVYVGGIVAFLGPCVTTTSRSLVTKCVEPHEVGAIFSIMGAFQAMMPLAAAPLYAFTYRATITTFPGAFLILSASLYLVIAVLLVVANLGLRRVEVKRIKSLGEDAKAAAADALLLKNEDKYH